MNNRLIFLFNLKYYRLWIVAIFLQVLYNILKYKVYIYIYSSQNRGNVRYILSGIVSFY